MGFWRLEGQLYDLFGAPTGEPMRPRVSALPRAAAPPAMPIPGGRATERRVDLAIRLGELPPEDATIIREHYSGTVVRSRAERKPSVDRLLELLGVDD